MLDKVADLQALVIGAILLWAGTWKVFVPRSWEIAVRSALALLFHRKSTIRGIYRLVGVTELTVGLLLLLPPYHQWEMGLASGVAAAFVVYVLFSLKAAPGRPCGCLGGHETTISGRTLARAGLVLMLALVGWTAQHFWLTAIVTNPWLLGLVGVETLLLAALSPELGWSRIKPLAHMNRRLQPQAELDCAVASAPMSETWEQLRLSDSFQSLTRYLKSDVLESWRDGCWRFLCFEAEYEGRKATAVFAVPVLRQPHRVRAAIVDHVEDEVLLTLGLPLVEGELAH